MRVGLFFGTFNPLHNAHLGISNNLLDKKIIDEVWLVLTPHSPHKKLDELVDVNIRLDMINEVVSKLHNIKVSEIELKMKKPNYTYLTLKEIKKKFPENEYVIIMGEDNFLNFDTWKNKKYISANFKIISYPRSKTSVDDIFEDYFDISSSTIRDLVKRESDISSLVPDEINHYIINKGLYR